MARGTTRRFYINAAVFIILETASLWFLYLSSDIHKSWLGQAMTDIMVGIWMPFDAAGSYLGLRQENERLALENMELYSQIQRIESEFPRQNDVWASRGYDFEYLPASVVSKSRNSQHNYVIVDRGLMDGVKEGDGIITPKGVIGIIQSSSQKFSSAITFTNTKLSVSARLGRDGFVGNLAWDGHGTDQAILSGIPLHAKFEVGDTVYTSGHSSVFPAGIPLAVVESSKVRGGSSAEIKVKLLEDMGCIRYVMIVKNNDREEVEDLQKE